MLKILNIDRSSPLLSMQAIGEGAFGKIYQTEFQGQNVVVKSLTVPFHLRIEARREKMMVALKELCICKIGASLGVSPLMPKVFGFDAVLYRTSF